MLVLSVLSLATLVLFIVVPPDRLFHGVLIYLDTFFSLFFLGDFFRSLYRAPNRWHYLRTWGWVDLLSGLPLLPVFRLARFARILRIVRTLRAMRLGPIVRQIKKNRAESTFLSTALVAIVAFWLSSVLVLEAEQQALGANILTAEDALWWAFVSITTVGYGDFYPVTNTGRLIAILLVTTGVGLFGAITSYLATIFLTPRQTAQTDEQQSELAAIRAELADIRQLLEAQRREKDDTR